VAAGYYFSINPAMLKSKNGQKIIKLIPKHLLLTESDGPFIDLDGNPVKPKDVKLVIEYLVSVWNLPIAKVEQQVKANFFEIVKKIRIKTI
jgi:Mg-dependent DNase